MNSKMSIYPLKIITSIYPRSIKQHFKIINITLSPYHYSHFMFSKSYFQHFENYFMQRSHIYTCIFNISIYFNLLVSFLFQLYPPFKINHQEFISKSSSKLLQSGKTFEHSLRFTPRQNRGSSPLQEES